MENELGEFSAGLIGDIVPTNEDPIPNIHTMETIVFVMKEGNVYKD